MTNYSCVKQYTARSFPEDLIIEVGEVVCVTGFLMNRVVIQLDERHETGFRHLSHVHCAIPREVFEKHFIIIEEVS